VTRECTPGREALCEAVDASSRSAGGEAPEAGVFGESLAPSSVRRRSWPSTTLSPHRCALFSGSDVSTTTILEELTRNLYKGSPDVAAHLPQGENVRFAARSETWSARRTVGHPRVVLSATRVRPIAWWNVDLFVRQTGLAEYPGGYYVHRLL